MDRKIINLIGEVKTGTPDCICFVCEKETKWPQRYEVSETEEVIICNKCMRVNMQNIVDTVISMRSVYKIAIDTFRRIVPPDTFQIRIDDIFTAPSNLQAYINQVKLLKSLALYLTTFDSSLYGSVSLMDLINVFRLAKNEMDDTVIDHWALLLVNMALIREPQRHRLLISTMQEMGPLEIKIIHSIQEQNGAIAVHLLEEQFKEAISETNLRLLLLNLFRTDILDKVAMDMSNIAYLTEYGNIFATNISFLTIKNN